jgi:hypothetical protein
MEITMLLNDVLHESSASWWNKALLIFDKLFGFESDGNSKLKRVKQVFDQKSGVRILMTLITDSHQL